jgi:hypothetical protein
MCFIMQSLDKRLDLLRAFGVVCNDAGGAGQIVAMLADWNLSPRWVRAEGPAKNIWKQMLPSSRFVNDLSWFDSISTLLTSTGWSGNVEHEARSHAKSKGIYSIAVLDHWVNYESRFIRDGITILPDEIWVVDEYAEARAKVAFPDVIVIKQEDYFARRQLQKIGPVSESNPSAILYLLEPIRSDWGRSEPGEFQALKYFFEQLPYLQLPTNIEILLRLHPSEEPEKYAHFLSQKQRIPIRIAEGDLASAISKVRWVAGVQTYAMTLALAAGRRVFSSLPPWAPPPVLPHMGIEYLRERLA